MSNVDIVELARRIDPTITLNEVRPGVVRKANEWSKEQWCRLVIAARSRGMGPGKLIRIVMQDYLNEHTLTPDFLPPAVVGVGAKAWNEAHTKKIADQGKLSENPFEGLSPSIIERLPP